MINATGTLLYNPIRSGISNEKQNTLILDLPKDDLHSYYQWFLRKKYGEKFILLSPMFGTHVTVIRNQEVDFNNKFWLSHQNEKLTISYSPENLERHWSFWSLTVHSTELKEIRKEFGLRTDFRLHITIGRQFDWQPKPILDGVIHDIDYPIN